MDNICAIVEYEYTAKESDELDLPKGAIIQRIKQMPGGWWQGTLKSNGKTGMFPDNFVRVLEAGSNTNGNHSDDSVQLREKSATSNRRCKVIYSYTQVNDDELTLTMGDVIEFLGEVEEGWWRGRLRTKVGVFPSNFVQLIEQSPVLASKRLTPIGAATAAKAAGITAAATAATTATAAATNTGTTTTKQTKGKVTASSTEDNTGSSAVPNDSDAAVPVPQLPPKPQREFCRVEFPYAPQNDDELELKLNDIIAVITTDLPDKGWWKGELRGKVGVFPDNFVKMLTAAEVAPINEPPQQSQRTALGKINSNTSHMTTTNSSTLTQQSSNSASTTSKVYIKKSGSSSNSTQGSSRKDSFGSRDSLNDILSETGLSTGNVAAQRKSLENKNLDLANAMTKKQSNTSITTTTTSTASATTAMSTNELRKSLDNLDEKAKSPPPPVLSKKPSVPLKKTPTGGVSSVAGNLLSGFKKKNTDSKLTSAVSHDLADGLAGSKLSPGQLPETGAAGNVVMRRAATIAVEDTDFDRVERASILTDMRQGRVKAPKRRPPSAAINVLGESNNNSVYVNGSGMGSSASELSEDGGSTNKIAAASSDENSTGEEQLAKPKPREWEKIKAPWMEELKASQVKKKTSPSVEPRGVSVAERTSKLFATESVATTNVVSSSSSSAAATTTTKLQSAAVSSSSIMQQSMYVESSHKKESSSHSSSSSSSNVTTVVNTNDAIMSKSMSAKAAASSDEESRVPRPSSLSLRNRSISPLVKSGSASSSSAQSQAAEATTSNASPAPVLNNHHNNAETKPTLSSINAAGDATRVLELERRVDKLESVLQTQQRSIEELVRALRDETDRVKLLRGELDKYAQCVTQV